MGRIAMARVVSALVALVATWLSFQQPCTAATTSTAAEASYAYSSPHVPIAQTTDHYDRGPPAAYNRPSAYDAVTRWPRAASTRPEGPTHAGETIDNDLAKSVQGVQVTGTTAEPAGRTGWDLSSVPRAGVAANTATRMGGSATFGGMDAATKNMIRFSERNPMEGYYDVIGHGSPSSLSGMSADELAAKIASSSGGQNIRLLSCQTGCPSGTFAQDLANRLGVRVMAPTTDIGASGSGKTLTVFDGGQWRWFDPN